MKVFVYSVGKFNEQEVVRAVFRTKREALECAERDAKSRATLDSKEYWAVEKREDFQMDSIPAGSYEDYEWAEQYGFRTEDYYFVVQGFDIIETEK